MTVLWRRGHASAREVIHDLELGAEMPIGRRKTVKTLLSRLVAKKVVSYRKDGRDYIYRQRSSPRARAFARRR